MWLSARDGSVLRVGCVLGTSSMWNAALLFFHARTVTDGDEDDGGKEMELAF